MGNPANSREKVRYGVVAAGKEQRLGGFKALPRFDGGPFVARQPVENVGPEIGTAVRQEIARAFRQSVALELALPEVQKEVRRTAVFGTNQVAGKAGRAGAQEGFRGRVRAVGVFETLDQ